jgi:polyhydroxyalkanoate synthesis regulator phasin
VSHELVLIDREALSSELQRVFDAQTSEVLLDVLDKVAAQVRAAGVTREDFSELKEIVRKLAETQQRTDQQVRELAEAQRRTEERVGALETTVERLAEAQHQTNRSIAELTEGIDRLRKQVGGLSDTVGGDIEDIAYIVLHDVLKREFGWEVGVLERSWETWNGEPEEVDIFGVASHPESSEKTIWIVGEAKHNLTVKEVNKFIGQVVRAKRHLVGEVFAVCFCYRARPEVQRATQEAGIRLVFSYGKLV